MLQWVESQGGRLQSMARKQHCNMKLGSFLGIPLSTCFDDHLLYMEIRSLKSAFSAPYPVLDTLARHVYRFYGY